MLLASKVKDIYWLEIVSYEIKTSQMKKVARLFVTKHY